MCLGFRWELKRALKNKMRGSILIDLAEESTLKEAGLLPSITLLPPSPISKAGVHLQPWKLPDKKKIGLIINILLIFKKYWEQI